MALTVEDGTGLPNAESYVSVAELTAYASLWGLSGFPTDTTKAEVLLRKATRAIDLTYDFIGKRATDTQALAWPRKTDDAPQGVPGDLKDATCEMAYVYLTRDPLAPLAAGEVGITEVTKEVGDLSTTTRWSEGTYLSASQQALRKVTFILQPLLSTSGSFMVGVERG